MKIKVFTNRVLIDYKKDFEKAYQYFKKHGLDFDFQFQETNLKNLESYKIKPPQGERIILKDVSQKLDRTNCDISMFVFNAEEFIPSKIPTGACQYPDKPFITISTHRNNPENLTYVEICHELMHALAFIYKTYDVMDTYRENFYPDSPTGNFAQQWLLLKPKLTMKYKYFNEKEIANLKPELCQILDKARDIAGVPFKITSGFRTKEQNEKVGGVKNSAHLTGEAVDIACNNSNRQNILRGLLNAGSPIWIEDAKKHIHIDIKSSNHKLGEMIVADDD